MLSGQGGRASQKNTQEFRLVSCMEGSSDTRIPLVEAAYTEDLPGFEITQSFNKDIEIYGLRRR